jgi:hypothetical protein
MFIAFEGPDNVGKSTSAAALAHSGEAIYNATKENHAEAVSDPAVLPETVVTFDRIDWFSHMVYRLSLPGHEWNDDRPRTVFAMPDTHLVIKLHRPDLAPLIDDELYETGKLAEVNPMYYSFGDFFMGLNEEREYALFKTVSLVEVSNDPRNLSFSQKLISFSSPVSNWHQGVSTVSGDDDLLEFLRHDDAQRV